MLQAKRELPPHPEDSFIPTVVALEERKQDKEDSAKEAAETKQVLEGKVSLTIGKVLQHILFFGVFLFIFLKACVQLHIYYTGAESDILHNFA